MCTDDTEGVSCMPIPSFNLVFSRHAQSVANAARTITSSYTDPSLTPEGMQQATDGNYYLHQAGLVQPDLLFSSTLTRAMETAIILYNDPNCGTDAAKHYCGYNDGTAHKPSHKVIIAPAVWEDPGWRTDAPHGDQSCRTGDVKYEDAQCSNDAISTQQAKIFDGQDAAGSTQAKSGLDRMLWPSQFWTNGRDSPWSNSVLDWSWLLGYDNSTARGMFSDYSQFCTSLCDAKNLNEAAHPWQDCDLDTFGTRKADCASKDNVKLEMFMKWLWSRPQVQLLARAKAHAGKIGQISLVTHGSFLKRVLDLEHHPNNVQTYKQKVLFGDVAPVSSGWDIVWGGVDD